MEQIQKDIHKLPEEAQTLLMEFIDSLKKRYSLAEKQQVKSQPPVTLDILKESGLIGCISAESDLSTNYKSVIREELNGKIRIRP